jgi:hypothetical protein
MFNLNLYCFSLPFDFKRKFFEMAEYSEDVSIPEI